MCLKFIDFLLSQFNVFLLQYFAAHQNQKVIFNLCLFVKISCVSCVITIHYVWEFFSPIGTFLLLPPPHIHEFGCWRWIKEWKFKARMEIYCEKIDFSMLTISELDIWPFLSPLGYESNAWNDILLCSVIHGEQKAAIFIKTIKL